jgi:hypothetical protein
MSIHRGDDRSLTVTASASMQGADLTFTARHRRHSEEVLIEKISGDGITLGPDPFTTATITIDAADTEDLTPDVLYWDLQLVDSSDEVHTVADGRLAILEDVTRPAS